MVAMISMGMLNFSWPAPAAAAAQSGASISQETSDLTGPDRTIEDAGSLLFQELDLTGPDSVLDGEQVLAISAGGQHTCVVMEAGGVICWGRFHFNAGFILYSTPKAILGLEYPVTAVTTGFFHSCALMNNGGVKCWGLNSSGQLGNGVATSSIDTALAVVGLESGVAAIRAGNNHTCALLNSGGVKCWGDNDYGQLGNGDNTDSNVPVDVTGATSGVSAITAGATHTCLVTTEGGARCWGRNNRGQLGDDTNTDRNTPVSVFGLTSGLAAIEAGAVHTCALQNNSGLVCWGRNANYQLGDGTTTDRKAPVSVLGLASGVQAISLGGLHSCALLISSGVTCWGSNSSG
jgi:alpha-tubulin suppressor-like RCC1 family protein